MIAAKITYEGISRDESSERTCVIVSELRRFGFEDNSVNFYGEGPDGVNIVYADRGKAPIQADLDAILRNLNVNARAVIEEI